MYTTTLAQLVCVALVPLSMAPFGCMDGTVRLEFCGMPVFESTLGLKPLRTLYSFDEVLLFANSAIEFHSKFFVLVVALSKQ